MRKYINDVPNFLYDTYNIKTKELSYSHTLRKKHKNYFIEVDLTKPKEDIIKYIETIKDEFDDDPSKFDNIHDKLGLIPEIFQCSIKDCEIFTLGKRGTNKPINGIMADILFIYDCCKVGLSKKYIIGEINRYWNNIKKINTDEMSESTYRKYKKIAIDYIENQKYECYLTGYKNSPSKETKPDN